MHSLEGRVALVTGGSRSVGKGIALGLCEAGATVYITGRSVSDRVAARVSALGGRAVAVPCDHQDDDRVKSVFEHIAKCEGRLDVLVNNAWGGYQRLRNRKANPGFQWKDPFWQQPLTLWDEMHTVGVRSNYIASVFAAQAMQEQGHGLIVSISFYAGRRYRDNVPYGVSKAAVDRLAQDMAVELAPHNVASVSLYPGHVIDVKKTRKPKRESAQFVGRAIAALATDRGLMKKTGQILVAAELAREYGFTDTDGTQPAPYDKL
ncbi:Enoyl-[acyl-carrier-protein] reductase [NADPH] FabL [Planctomycetes bacterium CA13]|uniref:Enoyl-[acyl-carrier-protein] reductase [NADPH] FabL n=1 Tax=Novipirellula herctigrandis TaxID=2527986 RepID=A0A5C5YYG4_9BACT|nr:Enoyl-[acyl-carrier-protein] reductase [NADPH] FabL [Planctomycetes bacterium CA13]